MVLDILAIGAHPDDIELGCGGSLAKLARAGARIHALVLSRGAVAAMPASTAATNRTARCGAWVWPR